MSVHHAARAAGDLEQQLEQYRRELTGYCYRMLGSSFEAEDAVQETMLRAWRSLDRFEGRSALKSWLYRIATNVCMDMLNGRKRRARPMELTEVGTPESTLHTLPEVTWLEPIPDAHVLAHSSDGDPAELAQAQETLRLAFVAALQHLPARQRAVLILREVLRWSAAETAELLDSSVASVNSALQRARATIADSEPTTDAAPAALDTAEAELLDCYVEAFEAYDMDSLVALLHEDATLSMPPLRPLAARRRAHRGVEPRSRSRMPWLAAHRDEGQRPARLRSVPAERARWRLRAVGAAGHRALKRADHGPQRLPGHGAVVPALRAAPRATGYRVTRPRSAARRTARRRRASARARARDPATAARSPAAAQSAAGARAPRRPRDRARDRSRRR